jgi:hypothetical protein
MALKPTRQIKSSRPFQVIPQACTGVFDHINPGTVCSVPKYYRDKILPSDYPGRTTVEVAASGIGPSTYAVEHIVSAATKDGDPFHKVYRYIFQPEADGGFVRHDVTHDYSSHTNGQVNDHHQSPQDTKCRLGKWPGFEHL